MRSLLAVAGLALCSSGAFAADFGIGIAARSTDDRSVYLPIDIGESFRIEPHLRYAKNEARNDVDFDKTLDVGVGVLGLRKVGEAARVYFGARLSYIESEYRSQPSGFIFSQDVDGFAVAPTFGFEYLFGQHLSLGGELEYRFVDLEGNFRQQGLTRDTERKSQGTQTRVVLRYKF
ncbi:hypothetical protein ACFPN2_08120 [Steroidobacter flavus]|uniref:Outer membrane protein beta-barrel domain-containing protein n=1 Tax=Steroidobacter flavus TaxID=1842136 RepID=A0ABV8SQA1_9GAMM